MMDGSIATNNTAAADEQVGVCGEQPEQQRATTHEFTISTFWDGKSLDEEDVVSLSISKRARAPMDEDEEGDDHSSESHNGITLQFSAPFYGDPAPNAEPGPTMHLWDHEVVEAFFLGDDAQYLEVEFGPHGHYLALKLHGERNIVEESLPLQHVHTQLFAKEQHRWTVTADIPGSMLPPGLAKFNAYAIHGVGEMRQYKALFPATKGEKQPDFHRLGYFQALPQQLLE